MDDDPLRARVIWQASREFADGAKGSNILISMVMRIAIGLGAALVVETGPTPFEHHSPCLAGALS